MTNAKSPRIGTLLVLGASGDLTSRLLLPGLAGLLASDRGRPLFLLGAGREEFTPSAWQRRVRDAFATAKVRDKLVTATAKQTRYVTADVTQPADLEKLLAECDGTPAIYFALPPAISALVCKALQEVELPEGTLLVMEKPFGVDEKSAAKLNALVRSLVPEHQIFRVDHFLGRSDVLNVLGLRFANRIFEAVWNSQHVEKIEIVYDEDLALEGRAGYYDQAGALIDMIQSHLLQVMALLMMEVPATLHEADLRDATAQVLRATRVYGDPAASSRRARYTAGTLGRRKVPAYTKEEGVDAGRHTETLAEMTVEVRNWRWAGVPITLRSGKALGTARKEAVIKLKPVPHLPEGLKGAETPDTIVIGFKPPRLEFGLDVNGPGDPLSLEEVKVVADFGTGQVTAYGEVLAGVLDGDPLLSVRGDHAEACWRIVEPVLAAWRKDQVAMDTYPAGSSGPRKW